MKEDNDMENIRREVRYAKARTVNELHVFLAGLIKEGKGNATLWFDTEGRKFDYHLARVGSVHYHPKELSGMEEVCFHEDYKKAP